MQNVGAFLCTAPQTLHPAKCARSSLDGCIRVDSTVSFNIHPPHSCFPEPRWYKSKTEALTNAADNSQSSLYSADLGATLVDPEQIYTKHDRIGMRSSLEIIWRLTGKARAPSVRSIKAMTKGPETQWQSR